MDNKKFGQFILKLRKEKGWTQLELAEKLNITDKAVSKWERGTGFPDIKMIEPLARIPGQTIPKDNASEAINNVIDVVAFQRKIERRNIIITATAFSTLIMLGTGLYLTGLSIYRARHHLPYTVTLVSGILALLFPLLIFLFLCFAFVLGGPVPT